MRVPVATESTVAPSITPGVRFNAPQVSNAGMEQVRQAGNAIQQGAQAYGKVQADILQDANRSQLKAGVNQLVDRRTGLLTEIAQLKGENALKRPGGLSLPDEFADRLKKDADGIAAGLGNDIQRTAFAEESTQLISQLRGIATDHMIKQHSAFSLEQDKASIATAFRQGVSQYWNDELVGQSVNAITSAVDSMSQREGWDKTIRDSKLAEALSPLHAAVIGERLRAGDIAGAKKYLSDNSSVMAADARAEQEKQLTAAVIGQRIDEIGSSADISWLRSKVRNLGDADYQPDLVGAGRARVRDYAEARIREIEAGQRVKAAAWKEQKLMEANRFYAAYESGLPLSSVVGERAERFYNEVIGTPLGEEFNAKRQAYLRGRTLSLSDLPTQQQLVSEAQARVSAAQTPEQAARAAAEVSYLSKQYARNAERIRANPFQYAAEVHGIEVKPLSMGSDLSSQLAERAQLVPLVKAATGINPGLLAPAEADALKQSLKAMSVQAQGQFFAGLRSVGDETARATIARLGAVDSVLMGAGMHSLLGHTERSSGKRVGNMILEGQKLLDEKSLSIPQSVGSSIDLVFKNRYGPVLAKDPAAYQNALQMTRAILALQAKESGSLDISSVKGNVLSAAALAIGRVGQFNERPVLLPYGMTESDFSARSHRSVVDALVAAGKSQQDADLMAKSCTLEIAGNGTYRIVVPAKGYAQKNNIPIMVEVR